MSNHLRLICLAVFAPLLAISAEKLVLRDGREVPADSATFGNDRFTLPDGRKLERNNVSDWWLGDTAAARTAAPAATKAEDEEARQRLCDLRTRGQEFAREFPGCRGVYIIDEGTFVFTTDEHNVYRYRFVGLVLSEDVLDWAQLTLGFSEGRSRQRIITARSLTPDDRLLTLDPASITVGSAPERGDVHFDPNSRMIAATIPGVEVGSIVEYKYEYESYAPEDWRLFFPGFYFQMDLPTCESRLRVQLPKGMPLYHWADNWDVLGPKCNLLARLLAKLIPGTKKVHVKSVVTVDGTDYDQYTWQKQDIPPVTKEPYMPPNNEVVPGVHASVIKEWEYLDKLTGSMQLERMVATPEIRELTEKLTADCKTRDERIAVLYHWVQKNIRYISVKASLSSGWTGHPAAETLAQGYGDCTDKSILLCTMLHVLGVEAEPAVLRTNDTGDFVPKYPVLSCNHCITEIRIDGKPMYLDSTTQDHRYPSLRADDHDVIAYNFVRGERRRVPIPPGSLADGKVSTETMILDRDGNLSVISRNAYTGLYEARLRGGWKRVPDEMRPKIMQQYLNGIAPGARLKDFDIPDPQELSVQFHLNYDFELPHYAVPAGNLRVFQVPSRERSFGETSLDTRRYPIVYTTSEAQDRNIEILLPPEYRIVDIPAARRIRHKHVNYSEDWEIRDNKLLVRIRFERPTRRVSPREYPKYRRALQQIEELTRRPVYFELSE